jgi:hypothetical protein
MAHGCGIRYGGAPCAVLLPVVGPTAADASLLARTPNLS